MRARQWRAAAAFGALLALASGCSLLPGARPAAPSGIDLRQGAYAAFYADSLSREAGVSTVSVDGTLLASQRMSALGLEHRADSPASIVLVGERAADLVFVGHDGTVRTAELDYPDGTGATAITWLDDGNLATLVNVGSTERGYFNPLVIHDAQGKVKASARLQGYFTFVGVWGDQLVVAGERAIKGIGDGSRVLLIDRATLSITRTLDWADAGGLQSCTLLDARLICLETGAYHDDSPPDRLANVVVSIDLATGRKSELTKLSGDGLRVATFDGRGFLASYEALSSMTNDLRGIDAMIPLAAGNERIEQVSITDAGIDVFVRDYDRVKLPDGRVDIGRIVRLDPRTLQVRRQTPLHLPDQQTVGVHLIAHEFFATS